MHLNWSRAHPYRGNLEGCAHSWDWVGRAISHGGAGYHRHYPTHHPQFGELLRARKHCLAVFQHRNLSFHNPFSVGYDYLCPNLWSPGCSFGMSRRRALVVVQTMALFYSTFPSYEGLSDIAACCEIFVVCSDSEAFFQSNYNISSYFPHHQHQNGKKSFTDGLQRSVLGMVPPPHLHSSRRSRKVEVEKKCTRYGCRLPAPL